MSVFYVFVALLWHLKQTHWYFRQQKTWHLVKKCLIIGGVKNVFDFSTEKCTEKCIEISKMRVYICHQSLFIIEVNTTLEKRDFPVWDSSSSLLRHCCYLLSLSLLIFFPTHINDGCGIEIRESHTRILSAKKAPLLYTFYITLSCGWLSDCFLNLATAPSKHNGGWLFVPTSFIYISCLQIFLNRHLLQVYNGWPSCMRAHNTRSRYGL